MACDLGIECPPGLVPPTIACSDASGTLPTTSRGPGCRGASRSSTRSSRNGCSGSSHIWLSDDWFSPRTFQALPSRSTWPTPAAPAGARPVSGCGRGVAGRVHAHHAPRGGPRFPARVPASTPSPVAGALRQILDSIPRVLPPESGQQALCPAPEALYAQSHPDEDFAETFAVWLRSRADWRKKYVGWPALKKLEYVDEPWRKWVGATGDHVALCHRA